MFISPHRPDGFRSPPSLLLSRYRGLSPRVKSQVREADHTLPASAEVKKTWIYASTAPYFFKMVA
jgi:hypothetical protein